MYAHYCFLRWMIACLCFVSQAEWMYVYLTSSWLGGPACIFILNVVWMYVHVSVIGWVVLCARSSSDIARMYVHVSFHNLGGCLCMLYLLGWGCGLGRCMCMFFTTGCEDVCACSLPLAAKMNVHVSARGLRWMYMRVAFCRLGGQVHVHWSSTGRCMYIYVS